MDNPGPPALPAPFPPGPADLIGQYHPRLTAGGRRNPAKPTA